MQGLDRSSGKDWVRVQARVEAGFMQGLDRSSGKDWVRVQARVEAGFMQGLDRSFIRVSVEFRQGLRQVQRFRYGLQEGSARVWARVKVKAGYKQGF